MSSNMAVAVVTGANKGIGFAIVRGLCKEFKGDVYLTARNTEVGQQAVEALKSEGLNPKFHQLDITNTESIRKLRSFLETNYRGLDILVNNAGIANKESSTASFAELAELIVRTNFTATLDVCNILFPLLRPHARVVNVSSRRSIEALQNCSPDLQKRFTDSNITMDQLKQYMQEYIEATKAGKHLEKGWLFAYGTSKIGVTVMSIIQQRLHNTDDIIINACCPGFVATDLTSFKGTKTIDEGAETPLYLALLPLNCQSPKGNFVSDKQIREWQAMPTVS